jgi:hypothetical protein
LVGSLQSQAKHPLSMPSQFMDHGFVEMIIVPGPVSAI